MSELSRLTNRFAEAKVTHFHVDWTEEADKLSAEERAREINRILDRVLAEQSDVIPVPRFELQQIQIALEALMAMSRMSISDKDFLESSREKDLKLRIFGLVEFPLISVNQRLGKE